MFQFPPGCADVVVWSEADCASEAAVGLCIPYQITGMAPRLSNSYLSAEKQCTICPNYKMIDKKGTKYVS